MEKTRESQTPSALPNSIPKPYSLAMKRTVHMKSSTFPHFLLFRFPPTEDVCSKTQISQISAPKSSPADCKNPKLSSPRVSQHTFKLLYLNFPDQIADTIHIGVRFSSTVSFPSL